MKGTRSVVFGLAVMALGATASAQEQGSIRNWDVPEQWAPKGGSSVNAFHFVRVAPCRVIDTRGNGFTGLYGPPFLTAGAPRSFPIWSQCGVPVGAAAVSVNLTVA